MELLSLSLFPDVDVPLVVLDHALVDAADAGATRLQVGPAALGAQGGAGRAAQDQGAGGGAGQGEGVEPDGVWEYGIRTAY